MTLCIEQHIQDASAEWHISQETDTCLSYICHSNALSIDISAETHTAFVLHVAKKSKSFLIIVDVIIPRELRLQAYRAPVVNHCCCGRHGALVEFEQKRFAPRIHEMLTTCAIKHKYVK